MDDRVRAEQAACDGGGHVAAAHVHPVGVDGEGDLVRVKVGARVCLVRVRAGARVWVGARGKVGARVWVGARVLRLGLGLGLGLGFGFGFGLGLGLGSGLGFGLGFGRGHGHRAEERGEVVGQLGATSVALARGVHRDEDARVGVDLRREPVDLVRG